MGTINMHTISLADASIVRTVVYSEHCQPDNEALEDAKSLLRSVCYDIDVIVYSKLDTRQMYRNFCEKHGLETGIPEGLFFFGRSYNTT